MRHIGEHRTEEHHCRDLGVFNDLDNFRRKRLPAARRLGAEQQVHVGPRSGRQLIGPIDRDTGPDDAARTFLIECDVGAIELVIEVVFGIHLNYRGNIQLVLERAYGATGRFARVVPALEGNNEHSSARESRRIWHENPLHNRSRDPRIFLQG